MLQPPRAPKQARSPGAGTRPKADKPLSRARRRLAKQGAPGLDLRPHQPMTNQPKTGPPLVQLVLKYRHSINGQDYAGQVRVREGIAAVLMEQEQNAARAEARFRDPDPPGRVIGPDGRVTQVDPSFMSIETLITRTPMARLSGVSYPHNPNAQERSI